MEHSNTLSNDKTNLSEAENGTTTGANGQQGHTKLSAELLHANATGPVPTPASFAHLDEKKILRKVSNAYGMN